VVGHWSEERVQKQIGDWSRVAAGWDDWQGAKFARFGDNMRFVAVTDGDKVEAETSSVFQSILGESVICRRYQFCWRWRNQNLN
jgi:L-arabinose isomerase